MTVSKEKILALIKELPDHVDIEDLMYRLYLLQKIESGEQDGRKGRLVSHEQVVQETARWFDQSLTDPSPF